MDFYPRPPRGGRRHPACQRQQSAPISIHALREEGDESWQAPRASDFISIHALREEGDTLRLAGSPVYSDFYPRPPRGGRPFWYKNFDDMAKFLSTPSARRATQKPREKTAFITISIHALREEGDSQTWANKPFSKKFLSTPSARRATHDHAEPEPSMDISIHALREEGDLKSQSKHLLKIYFYPRPPRGGRRLDSWHYGDNYKISIHALREEGDLVFYRGQQNRIISIHALREEGDVQCERPGRAGKKFLSTPSARRATARRFERRQMQAISIHALREEGDGSIMTLETYRENFYPRPPRGGRLDKVERLYLGKVFLSTPSARRATEVKNKWDNDVEISIHALREEGDLVGTDDCQAHNISIHALREEGDREQGNSMDA